MKYILFGIGICYASWAMAEPQITVSPQTVSYGDRVQLVLSDDKPIQNLPDLSSLQNDFVIRGQQQMESTSVVNGVKTENHQLILSLFPKRKGALEIGPFDWNGKMFPKQTLTVAEQTQMPSNGPTSDNAQSATQGSVSETAQKTAQNQQAETNKRVFEAVARIEPQQIYEGESAVYTIRLSENIGLTQAQIQTPNNAQYTLTPFGQDKMEKTMLNGEPVRSYERAFLLTPDSVGTFELTGGVLGLVPDMRAQRQRIPQAFGMFPDFFGEDDFFNQAFGTPQKEVYAGTNTATLTVKPKPADWSGWWLPSRDVQLKELTNLKETEIVTLGTPIERHVQLSVLGVDGNKLPLLTQPVSHGIQAYANPDKRTVIETEKGPVGIEEITFVIVPTETGDITIPAIRVKWFNTVTEQVAVAEVPARTITVVAEGGAGESNLNNSDKNINTAPHLQNSSEDVATPVESSAENSALSAVKKTSKQGENLSDTADRREKNAITLLEKMYEIFGVFELMLAVIVIAIFGGVFVYMKRLHRRKRYLDPAQNKSKKQGKEKPLPDLYPFE